MSKKNIILVSILGLAVIISMGILFYIQSLKTVSFEVKQPGITVKVRPANSSSYGSSFSSNKTVQLAPGKYIAVIEGGKFDTSDIPFEVTDRDITVTIDPSYSKTHLKELFASESSAINKALTEKYAAQLQNFTVENGNLYKQGEWYATILVKKTLSRSDEPDLYRVVMKKEQGKWTVKTTPALILSAKEYPDIPVDILIDINKSIPG